MIVNGMGKVVRGKPWSLVAAFQQHNIVYVVLMFDSSADLIDELNSARWTIRRTKADRIRLPSFETTDYVLLCEITAARPLTVVTRMDLCRQLLLLHLSQLFTSAKTEIRVIVLQEL